MRTGQKFERSTLKFIFCFNIVDINMLPLTELKFLLTLLISDTYEVSVPWNIRHDAMALLYSC